MHFIDTHIHLQDFTAFEPKTLMQKLLENQIDKCICVSSQPEDWPKVSSWADNFSAAVVPAFAVHPWYTHNLPTNWADNLENLLKTYPHALIGECGFDTLKNQDISAQQQVFDIHINLAHTYRRTLLIHAVKAQSLLEHYWQKLPQKFVIHSFNGSLELLKQIVKAGGYAAFNPKIFKNKQSVAILQYIPDDRILLESDAPYQSSFENLARLCEKIGEIRNKSLEEMSSLIYANSMEIMHND